MSEESSRRSRRAFIWGATGVALLVVGTCFALSADLLTGAVEATRYSARFSALVMAAAIVARAPRPLTWAMRRTELTLAFVAAHGVHYATVVLRALVEPGNKLRGFTIDAVVVVLLGLGLLAVVAGTARATSLAGRRTHAVAFYVAWTALTLASTVRARVSVVSAVVLAVLGAAMLWRVASGLTDRRSSPALRT
ncbi:MAG TPA: hypothetical protein VFN91_17400 [Myxococcaceae bacterium]|nr:hypothetical protein [Myxococcaceae bacterium]